MKIELAYELMRNPSKVPLINWLQCHATMLRAPQPLDKSQMIAEAIADLCESVEALLPKGR
jgi:hypothetical protein